MPQRARGGHRGAADQRVSTTPIVAASTAVTIFVVLLIVKRLIVSRFGKIAKRTTNRFDDMIVATLAKTRTWVLVAFALLVALDQLTLHVLDG